MLPLVAGLVAFIIGIFLVGSFLRVDVRTHATSLKRSGGVVLAVAAVGLAVMGRIGLAVPAGLIAWSLLFGQSLPNFGGRSGGGGGQSDSRRSSSQMSRSEAFNLLGLREGASDEEIRAAHRRLIQQTHPDRGGTDYLAAKINEAKDALLGH